MTRRTAARRALLAALVAGGFPVLLAGPGGAATAGGAGWWYRPNASALPLAPPAPPVVGDGQLLVQGQPEGPTAVAAVRFQLDPAEGEPVLRIRPASGSTVPAGASVQACRAIVAWPDAKAGKWEDRPLADCSKPVAGVIGEGGVIDFALAPLLTGQTLDVVLTPGTVATPAGGAGSAFTLVFDKPSPTALRTTRGPSTTGGDPTPTGPGPDASTFALPPTTSLPALGGLLPDGSAAPLPLLSTTATAPPASASTVLASPPQARVAAPAVAVGSASRNDRAKLFGFLVLLGAAAAAYWAATTPAPAALMAGIGRFARPVPRGGPGGPGPADPAMGGLGRFARRRTGPPPPLG